MITVALDINGREHRAEIDPRMLLVEFVRRRAGLTGTHVGCDTSQCGACTVHLDGIAVKSCTVFAAQAEGHAVTTIEGVSPEEGLSPLQAAFKEHHALQCGFCTPGMIMSALDMIRRGDVTDEASVRAGLEGNLCRCTGYQISSRRSSPGGGDGGGLMYPYRYHRPATVSDAGEMLAEGEDARPPGGGMSLIPVMKHRLAAPTDLVDLGSLATSSASPPSPACWRSGR